MDRRSFLASSAKALIGSVAFTCPFAPTTVHAAVDPATVTVVIQTVISLVRLFESTGNSNQLQRLQVEMLRAIERELQAINNGILLIIAQLEKIETLLGQVPFITAQELKKQELAGMAKLFAEWQETYLADVRDFGIIQAQARNIERLKSDIITPVTSSRAALTATLSPAVIPSVCSACFVEIEGLIVANTPRNQMRSAVRSYLIWLNEIVKLLSQKIEEESSTFKGLMSKARISEKYLCFLKARGLSGPGPAAAGVGFLYHEVQAQAQFSDPPDLDQSMINDMVASGVLPTDERPVRVSVTFQETQPVKDIVILRTTALARTLLTSPCDALNAQRSKRAAELTPELLDSAYKLMSYRSLRHAAVTTINYAEERRRSIEALSS